MSSSHLLSLPTSPLAAHDFWYLDIVRGCATFTFPRDILVISRAAFAYGHLPKKSSIPGILGHLILSHYLTLRRVWGLVCLLSDALRRSMVLVMAGLVRHRRSRYARESSKAQFLGPLVGILAAWLYRLRSSTSLRLAVSMGGLI